MEEEAEEEAEEAEEAEEEDGAREREQTIGPRTGQRSRRKEEEAEEEEAAEEEEEAAAAEEEDEDEEEEEEEEEEEAEAEEQGVQGAEQDISSRKSADLATGEPTCWPAIFAPAPTAATVVLWAD